jgi:RND superfamily putative drug exporter
MRLQHWAHTLFRHRRRALWGSLAVVIVAGVLGLPVFSALDSGDDFDDPSAQAVRAREQLSRVTGASPAPDLVALVKLPAEAASPRAQHRIDQVAAELRGPGVAAVARFEPGGDRALVSRDGRSTTLLVTYRHGASGVTTRIEDRVGNERDVTLGGNQIARSQVGDQVSTDIARAETLAVPILFLLSLVVFRGVVAALLPLAVGAATIFLSFLVMRAVNGFAEMSVYALNLINGLGLGLAIDYSLFMVSRYREELATGRDREEALARTLSTAGRTVLFSAITVAAALAALLVFRQRFLYSMGVGGLVCALLAALVSLTMLPALLGALGERVNAGSPARWRRSIERDASGASSGPWYRFSRWVMRRPVPIATVAAVVLIALGLPFTRIAFTGVDASVLPHEQSARVVDDALRAGFAPSESSPIYASVRAPASAAPAVREWAAGLAKLPGATGAPVVQPVPGGFRVDVRATGPPLGDRAQGLVRAIRDRGGPQEAPTLVGGQSADFVDQQHSLAAHLPLALAILVVTTLVILFLMTGSIVLPIKALVMNVLTISAAFGLLVLVFQDGRLEGLLGFTSQHAIESSQPILLFAVAFGLSTDYGVFLLGRIKELHDRGLPNEEAVAVGLQRTGRIVTFAALLFVIAIGAFVTSQIIFIKQLGFGTALAVLIDATIVRALLVPSLMRLLGDANWWAPRPLARLHRRIGLTEGAPA